MIRLTIPFVDEAELDAVRHVLTSGFLVQGPSVAAFERAVAKYVATKHAVAVSSGTAALHLALLTLGLQSGDIVLTTAYSYPATANVIELCGAQPVFVDIQRDTYNIDPDCLRSTLTKLMSQAETARKVKAILPVHAFGQLVDMPAILEIAGKYDVPVVEDAACALGAKLHGRQAGTWGVMGCFSFHPRKAITTAEGGIIATNDVSHVKHIKALRNHGQDPDAPDTEFILPGYNYRMTDLQGALGVAQMAKLERVIKTRQRLAAIYDQLLRDTQITPPVTAAGSEPIYQSYVALLPPEMAVRRASIIRELKAQGIETTIGTWHIPMTSYFRTRYHFARGDFPNTDEIFSRAITLPLHEGLSDGDPAIVVRHLRQKRLESAA